MAISETDFEAANRRMADRLKCETRAVAAHYDAGRGRIVIELSTGADISFPAHRLEGLAGAAPADLAEIEISPAGIALHFPRLDADFALTPLLSGITGSRKWMAAQLGAQGGKSVSENKVRAAITNGRLGGRPSKLKDLDLTRDEAKRILRFVGYGNLSARFWFIGLEEGLSSEEKNDLQHNLKSRGTWSSVMDLAEACLTLRHNGKSVEIKNYPHLPKTPTWRWMAKVCLWLDARRFSATNDEANDYVRRYLGRKNGQTFLTELSPIPSRNQSGGPLWLDFFRKAEEETDALIKERQGRLRSLIAEHQPPFIFCYGAERDTAMEQFKVLLPNRNWIRVGEKSQISVLPNSVAILMPFLGVGRLTRTEFAAVMDAVHKAGVDYAPQ
jgi:hypothetical protein